MISDSLNIQFWLNGQLTYNESTPFGVNKKCFYQPSVNSDEHRLQFPDTEEKDYKLTIFDCQDNQLAQLDFTVEEIDGLFVYSLTFTFLAQGITNECTWVQISSFLYTFSLAGGVISPLQEVEGEMTFLPESLLFDLEGGVESPLQEVAGDLHLYFEGSFRLGDDTETICDEGPQTLYSSEPFGVGVIMYYDSDLVSPVTGFTLIESGGVIYNLNTLTGEVGSATAIC